MRHTGHQRVLRRHREITVRKVEGTAFGYARPAWVLARVRRIVHAADPEVVETWKWRGVPVWEHAGIICTGETYQNYVKLTFAKGAALADPAHLFNASLEGNVRLAIDIREEDPIDEAALADLVRAAVALNLAKRKGR